jgi:hypothetical protein
MIERMANCLMLIRQLRQRHLANDRGLRVFRQGNSQLLTPEQNFNCVIHQSISTVPPPTPHLTPVIAT